jgi:hypothetical protein
VADFRRLHCDEKAKAGMRLCMAFEDVLRRACPVGGGKLPATVHHAKEERRWLGHATSSVPCAASARWHSAVDS